jgi:2'-5' RNA ligase
MIYALVHYPAVDTRPIDQLRLKYDPQVGLIGPHITLMFPVPDPIGDKNLIRHLERVLSRWQPFSIHLQGFQISADDHLFLLIREGNSKIIRLHGEIYTDILAAYRTNDIPFVPHLTLGVLNKDQHERVLEEVKQLDMDYHCVLDKLHLVRVNDDRSKIVWSREFVLTE